MTRCDWCSNDAEFRVSTGDPYCSHINACPDCHEIWAAGGDPETDREELAMEAV